MKDLTGIAVALLLLVSVPHRGDAAVPVCPSADTALCYNCQYRGDCSNTAAGDPATKGIACGSGEACTVVSGVAACSDMAQVPGCDCGGSDVGCDKYNTDQIMFCIPDSDKIAVLEGDDCSATSQTCLVSECVDPSINPCEGYTKNGYIIETPKCTSAIFCSMDVYKYTKSCLAEEYFNIARSKCEPFPPNPCTGCSTRKCPIISDCTKYAICDNGQIQEPEESCPAGEYFNPKTEACEANDVVCGDYKNCIFELPTTTTSSTTVSDSPTSTSTSTPAPTPTPTPTPTTTNTPTLTPTLTPTPTPTTTKLSTLTPTTTTLTSSPTPTTTATLPTTTSPIITSTAKPSTCTAANENIRYPDETECKNYWTCRLITASSYGYVKSSCPGAYVFNPTSKYCDLASNVLDCNV